MKGRWIKGKFATRAGTTIDAPEWFLKMLPKGVDIEGELYFGRNTFHKTGSLRSRSSSSSWQHVEFHVFDLIDYKMPWIERQAELKEQVECNDYIKLVRWKKIRSVEHLERKFNRVVEKGGEGVVLASPWGMYEDGHVEQILKYKVLNDCEAIVIGYRTDDSGKRLASLVVHPLKEHNHKPNEKITFNIGTGLKVRHRYDYEKRFPIGTVVTYTYEVMGKNGKPRTPVYKGIRTDLTN